MSFLKIKALHRDYKECQPENVDHSKQSDENCNLADSEGIYSPIDDNVKGNNGNEDAVRQRKLKILSGEKSWRVPRQAQFHVRNKPTVMPPGISNSQASSLSFPKLIPISEDGRKVDNVGDGILIEKRRTNSAPGYSHMQARVRKLKYRLPNIPDLQTLSVIENQPMKSLVVEGKKLGSAGDHEEFSSKNDKDFSNSESKVVDENLSNYLTKANDKTESVKERCHGDACEDSFPRIKKTEFRIKTAYATSSRMFNTYLQSRFGKSVYEGFDKTTDRDASKRYQVYWAPVLIKKKVLYNRTEAADSTQENCEDVPSTKEKKVHFGRVEASV